MSPGPSFAQQKTPVMLALQFRASLCGHATVFDPVLQEIFSTKKTQSATSICYGVMPHMLWVLASRVRFHGMGCAAQSGASRAEDLWKDFPRLFGISKATEKSDPALK